MVYYEDGSAERAKWQGLYEAKKAERKRLQQAKTSGDDLTELYGSATLRDSAGFTLSSFAEPEGITAIPLGRDATGDKGFAWLLFDSGEMEGHAVTFGATRSGKGVSSIIPSLLSYNGSMIVIDPKGENAWTTMERRKAMGQRVVVLDPWGEVQRRYGSKASPPVEIETSLYNPLSAIDPASEDFADDVAAIADALVIPSLGNNDAHWTDSARELVGGLVALCIEAAPGIATLGDVRMMIAAGGNDLSEAIKAAVEANPESLAARKLMRFTRDTNEVHAVRSVAETQLGILDSRRLVESMTSGENPFNLTELGTGRVTLYLVLPLDRLETHGRWLRLIITMAIRAIARLDTLPSAPVYFLLDEAGTIGALRMVEQAFGLMSGVGIRISLYLQDLVQLQKDYPRSWETFISNSSVIQALKVTDITTSEYLSKLMGNTTRQRISGETMQIREGEKGIFGKAGDPTATTISDQVHSRALMLPQEIREKIGDKRVLVIAPGLGNLILRRMPYYAEDSIWAGLYRDPPWFTAAKAARIAEAEAAKAAALAAEQAAAEAAAASKKKGWFG